jgi:flavorubredoxin
MDKSFRAEKVTDKVWWVGAVDWSLKDFHGYSTERGTTYNAYLVTGEKNVLIDTVKAPFLGEMLARISSVIDPEKIDFIISNHSEMDHSGGLPGAVAKIKPKEVFASEMGVKALQAHFGVDFAVTPVRSGGKLNLGGNEFVFAETRMLHWPDSMFTYLAGEKVLFSQDAFGMHLAGSRLFEDEIPFDIIEWEGMKYFANILMPFSQQVLRLIEALPSLNLDISVIAPDHGPVWRKDIMRVVEMYRKWAARENMDKVLILYDTMWKSTEKMAFAIADGARSAGPEVKVLSMSAADRSRAATEALKAGALIAGSPTMNNNLFPTMADVMTYLKGLRPLGLVGAAFGSYGWSGESAQQLADTLKAMKADLVAEPLKVKYVPTSADISACFDLGVKVAEALKAKLKA